MTDLKPAIVKQIVFYVTLTALTALIVHTAEWVSDKAWYYTIPKQDR